MFKKFFLPHTHNQYRPHIFRTTGIIVMLIGCMVILGIHTFQRTILEQTTYLASVVSSTLVDLTNADRNLYALNGLTQNPLLTQAAQAKADDMAAKGYFAHVSPDGVTPWHWFGSVGYEYLYAGENLAVNFDDSTAVEQAWMNSPLHRANIVNGSFTEIGIATSQGTYQGRPTTFVVQLFGRPLASVSQTSVTNKRSPLAPLTTSTPLQRIVASTTNFVVVSRATSSSVLGESSSLEAAAATTPSPLKTIITSPSRTSYILLIIMAIVIVISIILIITIEVSRKDIRHSVLGLLALAVIVALIFYFKIYLASGVMII